MRRRRKRRRRVWNLAPGKVLWRIGRKYFTASDWVGVLTTCQRVPYHTGNQRNSLKSTLVSFHICVFVCLNLAEKVQDWRAAPPPPSTYPWLPIFHFVCLCYLYSYHNHHHIDCHLCYSNHNRHPLYQSIIFSLSSILQMCLQLFANVLMSFAINALLARFLFLICCWILHLSLAKSKSELLAWLFCHRSIGIQSNSWRASERSTSEIFATPLSLQTGSLVKECQVLLNLQSKEILV